MSSLWPVYVNQRLTTICSHISLDPQRKGNKYLLMVFLNIVFFYFRFKKKLSDFKNLITFLFYSGHIKFLYNLSYKNHITDQFKKWFFFKNIRLSKCISWTLMCWIYFLAYNLELAFLMQLKLTKTFKQFIIFLILFKLHKWLIIHPFYYLKTFLIFFLNVSDINVG